MWTIIRRSLVTPIVPTTPSLPQPPPPPPTSDSAAAASAWDRLEADIKALQQQALATQKAIQQVQAREPDNPLDAVQLELPRLPGVDGTVVGVAAVLGLTMALLWWYLWMRPQTRLQETLAGVAAAPVDAPEPHPHVKSAESIVARFAAVRAQRAEQAVADTTQAEDPDSLFARYEQHLGFDSEAAASEVVRVRKSLADKREARALQRERGEMAEPIPSVRAWLDQDTPAPLDGVQVTSGPIPIAPATEPVTMAVLEPEPEPPLAPHQPEPPPELELPAEPDYAITLALAEESEALDLWPEARELATEVLDSHDAGLRALAEALLHRLDALAEAHALESLPPPEDDETPPRASQFHAMP